MPGFYLYDCSENYNALDLAIGADEMQYHEGNLMRIDYRFKEGKNPSWLQVTRNYENAIITLGGKKIFSNQEFASYRLTSDGKDVFIQLKNEYPDDPEVIQFALNILEKEGMKQDITAGEIYAMLTSSGFCPLNFLFETGKSTIKSESMYLVDEVAEMMQGNETLKVSIEGHTDNVGTAATNKTLSEERANAVMAALVSKGIDQSRLSAKGWGQEKPVADNETEEGRAKNRRVEIVKM
jgi:outer membrane protein OmpA-like peptidoglycan-associated protein